MCQLYTAKKGEFNLEYPIFRIASQLRYREFLFYICCRTQKLLTQVQKD